MTGNGNLRGVQFNFSIHFLPKINTLFVNTLPTPEGRIKITMCPSRNEGALLVIMHDNLVAKPRTSHCTISWPDSYLQQKEMFHPIPVGVCWLIYQYSPQTEWNVILLLIKICQGKKERNIFLPTFCSTVLLETYSIILLVSFSFLRNRLMIFLTPMLFLF